MNKIDIKVRSTAKDAVNTAALVEISLKALNEKEAMGIQYSIEGHELKSKNDKSHLKLLFKRLLEGSIVLNNCQTIDLSFTPLDSEIINLLIQLFENHLLDNLENLKLCGCSIVRQDLLAVINTAKTQNSLVTLDISHNYTKYLNNATALKEDFELIDALFELEKHHCNLNSIKINNMGFDEDGESGFFIYTELYQNKAHNKIMSDMGRPSVYQGIDSYQPGQRYHIHNAPFRAYPYVFQFINKQQINDAALYNINSLEKLNAVVQFLATNDSLTKISLACSQIREDDAIQVLKEQNLCSNIYLQTIQIYSAETDLRYKFHGKASAFCEEITQRNKENVLTKQSGIESVKEKRGIEDINDENKQLLLKVVQLNAALNSQKQLTQETQQALAHQEIKAKEWAVMVSNLQEKLVESEKTIEAQRQEIRNAGRLECESDINMIELMDDNAALRKELKGCYSMIQSLGIIITQTSENLQKACDKTSRLALLDNKQEKKVTHIHRLFFQPKEIQCENTSQNELIRTVEDDHQVHPIKRTLSHSL